MTTTQNITPAISWKDSIWFSDVDDTLIDTMGASIPGSEGIRDVFERH